MKQICLYFQIHQPYRLKKYRFFNIGKDHFYFDDFSNRTIIDRVATTSYAKTNEMLLRLIERFGGAVKVSFSVSGIALEQLQAYAPQVIYQFQQLASTGSVEFLAETYAHSLSSLKCPDEFKAQVKKSAKKVEELFGQKPTAFRNTELIYSDKIGELIAETGYQTVLTEGTKHILGWKSPNFVYSNPIEKNLKLLLRNYKLSDDLAFRFADTSWSEFPLDVDKYMSWLNNDENRGDVINLFMDYETFGEHIKWDTGIFGFMEDLLTRIAESPDMEMSTPSEVVDRCRSVASLHVPHPISWADEERDLSAWLGNELQDEAISKLYALKDMVDKLDDKDLNHVWLALQSSDHFYYMCTKWFADGRVHQYFNPYDSPYEAFMNYMNVLSDFARELEIRCKNDKKKKK